MTARMGTLRRASLADVIASKSFHIGKSNQLQTIFSWRQVGFVEPENSAILVSIPTGTKTAMGHSLQIAARCK